MISKTEQKSRCVIYRKAKAEMTNPFYITKDRTLTISGIPLYISFAIRGANELGLRYFWGGRNPKLSPYLISTKVIEEILQQPINNRDDFWRSNMNRWIGSKLLFTSGNQY